MRERYRRIDRGEQPDRVLVRIFGATHAELFENAAEAMFSLGYDVASIPPTYSRPIVAPGEGLGDLLVNWLEEVVHASATAGLVWSSFIVDRLETGGVQGSASGMPADQVECHGVPARGLADTLPTIVDVPDGHWVDLGFEIEAGLRPD